MEAAGLLRLSAAKFFKILRPIGAGNTVRGSAAPASVCPFLSAQLSARLKSPTPFLFFKLCFLRSAGEPLPAKSLCLFAKSFCHKEPLSAKSLCLRETSVCGGSVCGDSVCGDSICGDFCLRKVRPLCLSKRLLKNKNNSPRHRCCISLRRFHMPTLPFHFCAAEKRVLRQQNVKRISLCHAFFLFATGILSFNRVNVYALGKKRRLTPLQTARLWTRAPPNAPGA